MSADDHQVDPKTTLSSQVGRDSKLGRSQARKEDHIDLCYQGDVSLKGDRGLWSEVQLVHNALPELKMSDLDLSVSFMGRQLSS